MTGQMQRRCRDRAEARCKQSRQNLEGNGEVTEPAQNQESRARGRGGCSQREEKELGWRVERREIFCELAREEFSPAM